MAWEPIETAPMDGTEIDVWARNDKGMERRICNVSWERMADWDGREFDGWTGMYPHYGGKYTPTHWMPLPEPPNPLPVVTKG